MVLLVLGMVMTSDGGCFVLVLVLVLALICFIVGH